MKSIKNVLKNIVVLIKSFSTVSTESDVIVEKCYSILRIYSHLNVSGPCVYSHLNVLRSCDLCLHCITPPHKCQEPPRHKIPTIPAPKSTPRP
jgi:hypothetical protein